MNTGTGIRQLL